MARGTQDLHGIADVEALQLAGSAVDTSAEDGRTQSLRDIVGAVDAEELRYETVGTGCGES